MNTDANIAFQMRKEMQALEEVRASLQRSTLTPEQQAAVALNAATSIVRDMPGVRENRGRVINAMTAEFRKRLQMYLPRL